MSCPQTTDLSAYIDGELDSVTSAAVGQHLEGCRSCAAYVSPFAEISIALQTEAVVDGPTADCPSSEALLNYALADTADLRLLDTHIAACDHCVGSLQRLQHRLSMLPEIAAPLPAALQRLAPAMATAPAPRPRIANDPPSLWERLVGFWRYPVLMPAAFAAGLLLYVVAQQMPLLSGGLPAAGSRAVSQPEAAPRRISVPEAWVYADPSPRANVLAKLSRGSAVTISTEERGWYRIVLADGRSGWIEARTLQ